MLYCILVLFPGLCLAQAPDGYRLVWADEFQGQGLPNQANWSYDVGDGCPRICGWGNQEWQYYTGVDTGNAYVAGGHLHIVAKREDKGGKPYTSARLLTRGRHAWQYGYFEVRAKPPPGRGAWSAIWLLPEANTYGEWPGSGEIDLLEHVGFARDSLFGTVHTEAYNHMLGTQQGGGVGGVQPWQKFHLYAVAWTPEKMDFFFDGKLYFSFSKEVGADSRKWPFDQPFHIIINLAVGGNLGGRMGVNEQAFPAALKVDYVRVYQK